MSTQANNMANLVSTDYLQVLKDDVIHIRDEANKYSNSDDPNINGVDDLISELKDAFKLYQTNYNLMVRNHHTEVKKIESYEEFTQSELLFKVLIRDSINTLYDQQKVISDKTLSTKASNKTATTIPKVKYPEISLQPFSGDKTQWDSWWQGFEAMVHSKNELDEVTKFTYLLSTLVGEAKRTVERFEVTATGYDLALKALKEKYSDPAASKQTLIIKLLDIKSPSVTRVELENFMEEFQASIHKLQLLKIKTADSEWILQVHLLRKLPQPVSHFVCDKADTMYPSIQQIMDNTKLYIKRHNLVDKPNAQGKNQYQQKDPAPQAKTEGNSTPSQKPSPQWSAKPAKKVSKGFSIASSSVQKTFNCIYCSQEHASRTCPQYPDRKGRIARLKALSRCTRCCQKHETTSCNVKLSACYKCAGDHHTWLCTEGKIQKPLVSSVNADSS